MNLNQISKILMLIMFSFFSIIVHAKDEVKVMFVAFEGGQKFIKVAMESEPKRKRKLDDDTTGGNANKKQKTGGGENLKKTEIVFTGSSDMNKVYEQITKIEFSSNKEKKKMIDHNELNLLFLSELPKRAKGQSKKIFFPPNIGPRAKKIKLQKFWGNKKNDERYSKDGKDTKINTMNYMALYGEAALKFNTYRTCTISKYEKKQFMLAGKKSLNSRTICIFGVHLDSKYTAKSAGSAGKDLIEEIKSIVMDETVNTPQPCLDFLVLGDFNMNVGIPEFTFQNKANKNRRYKCKGHEVKRSSSNSKKAYMGAVFCIPFNNKIKTFDVYYGTRYFDKKNKEEIYYTDHQPIYVEAAASTK